MGTNSKIQWTDHTVNFFTGCTKVSPGCRNCYMYRDMDRYGKDPKQVVKVSDKTIMKNIRAAKPGDKIFVNSWSDFFIEEADEWRADYWKIIKENDHLIWQILTKRSDRIKDCLPDDWGEGYENVWLGVSVENQDYVYRAVDLIKVPAKIRFLSCEPLIGNIELTEVYLSNEERLNVLVGWDAVNFERINWVIVGGESGNTVGKYQFRECDQDWILNIVFDCWNFQVPVFVKQTGTHLANKLKLSDRHGGNIEEWPSNIQKRQFPYED